MNINVVAQFSYLIFWCPIPCVTLWECFARHLSSNLLVLSDERRKTHRHVENLSTSHGHPPLFSHPFALVISFVKFLGFYVSKTSRISQTTKYYDKCLFFISSSSSPLERSCCGISGMALAEYVPLRLKKKNRQRKMIQQKSSSSLLGIISDSIVSKQVLFALDLSIFWSKQNWSRYFHKRKHFGARVNLGKCSLLLRFPTVAGRDIALAETKWSVITSSAVSTLIFFFFFFFLSFCETQCEYYTFI